MAAPTILESVLIRVPFLVNGSPLSTMIEHLKAEVFAFMQKGFAKEGVDEDDLLNEENYTILQRSLVADLVSIILLKRKVVMNMEGEGGSDATGNSLIKKAKAGEAEVEFMSLKGSDGAKLLMDSQSLIRSLKMDATDKAHAMGLIISYDTETQMSVNALSQPSTQLIIVDW